MNRANLKSYAPQARREFIQAMTDRAAFYGLTAENIEPVLEQGDVALIGGKAFPKAVAAKRKRLEVRVKRDGFAQTMEAMAYTWFNRLVAIRYMELHGYLEHGYRVLSNSDPAKSSPEILEQAQHVELPGLKPTAVIEMKLDGNRESELYRMILVAQCNALHTAMPFLFEKIDDETELLLPDNLLHSDSLIRKLVNEIDEEDWQEVEIIGWLYQFYISERKDEVIGKVVASEDIPAATQLFTPNWIVKYLVQNTLGRQWLATYPQSALRQQMEYYIEPAEQTPEVQEQLKAITPTSLNPEELTLLDPACGSGHILVEAYDLFKAIYQERGYRAKDIPALILQKNLFGLEIDDRAAQLAAFALMMKARADDRRIFDSEAKPNVVAIQDSKGLKAEEIAYALNAPINKEDVPKEYLFEEIQEEKDGLFSKKALAEKGHVSQADIAYLLELFENAKTFGSLIQIPPKLAAKLPEIEKRLEDVLKFGDLTHASAHVLKPLLQQAWLLARQYDAVVANPPYMGSKYLNTLLKSHLKSFFKEFDKDLFSASTIRFSMFSLWNGRVGMMTPFVWMFISRHAELRMQLTDSTTLESLVQLEYSGFAEATVPVCAFTLYSQHLNNFNGSFIRLSDFKGSDIQPIKTLEAIRLTTCKWRYNCDCDSFRRIPGRPIAYWLTDRVREVFSHGHPLSEIAPARQGMATGDNNAFLRLWFEVDRTDMEAGLETCEKAWASGKKWFPFSKGGDFRKWYGNHEVVIRFDKAAYSVLKSQGNHCPSQEFYFRPFIACSAITSAINSFRLHSSGFVFDVNTRAIPISPKFNPLTILGFCNSRLVQELINALNPTLALNIEQYESLPFIACDDIQSLVEHVISESKADWDSSEVSWDFERLVWVGCLANVGDAPTSYDLYCEQTQLRCRQVKELETQINQRLLDAYGLNGEFDAEVPDDQITLYRPDREEDIKRLLSYAIGCMMGRYSLDKPGLFYAHSGNQGFDPSQYKTFRADDDGIIPLLETDWGIRDDATNRFVEFIGVAWPKEHLEENLKFVADSLGPNNGEQARETIRRYLATGFYKHHLSMYKKRPIYWLFSSGKQRAFQCLVYLHRYHEGTLARMRTEYVIPLQGRYAANIEQLATDISSATSTSQRKKLEKERDKLIKQQAELQTFDEKLKHAADQRISLDLDDGVKVNYGKFGDLLAEVKSICRSKEDD